MKHIVALLLITMIMFFGCSACVTITPSSQTTEPQETVNGNNTITESEVRAFFNDDNEFAINMLHYPAADMTNLKDVMLMILYPLGANYHNQISFSEFNSYTMKYLNKS